jgi:hypothetical protein
MALDVFHLLAPASIILAESFKLPAAGNFVEA